MSITSIIQKLSDATYLSVTTEKAIALFDDIDTTSLSVKTKAGKKNVDTKTSRVTHFKTTVDDKDVKVLFPFNGEVCDEDCQAIKLSYGLHTQCTNLKLASGDYCLKCQDIIDKTADGNPKVGNINDRMGCGITQYVDNTGKKTVTWLKYLEKKNIDIDVAKEAAKDAGIDIHEDHFSTKKTKRSKKEGQTGPKRPPNSYIMFLNAHREEFKTKNPEMTTKDITSAVASLWNSMNEEEKKPWLVKYATAKAEYDEAVSSSSVSSTEETTEKPVKKTTEKPVKKTTEKPVKKTTEKPAKKTTEKPAKKQTKKTTKKPVVEPVVEPVVDDDNSTVISDADEMPHGMMMMFEDNDIRYYVDEEGNVYHQDNTEEPVGKYDDEDGSVMFYEEL